MTITDLAKEMNVSENDVVAFVECLKVWIAKGYSIEQAIEKHMAQMVRLVNNAVALSSKTELVVEAFYA